MLGKNHQSNGISRESIYTSSAFLALDIKASENSINKQKGLYVKVTN